MIRAAGLILLFGVSLFGSDLNTVKAEPNLEKRARAAMVFAQSAITESRTAYVDGDDKKAFDALTQVRAASDLALESLNATGKNARRSPKHFKNLEKQVNELIRRLDSLEQDFSVDDRPAVQAVLQRLHEIHDELITRIMGKKK